MNAEKNKIIEKHILATKNVFAGESSIEFTANTRRLPLQYVKKNRKTNVNILMDISFEDMMKGTEKFCGITETNLQKIIFPEFLNEIGGGFIRATEDEEEMLEVVLDFSKCKKVTFDAGAFSNLYLKELVIPEESIVSQMAFSNCVIEKLVVGQKTHLKTGAFCGVNITSMEVEDNCVIEARTFISDDFNPHYLQDLKIGKKVCFVRQNDSESSDPYTFLDYFFSVTNEQLYSFSGAEEALKTYVESYGTLFVDFRIEDWFTKEACAMIRENEIQIPMFTREYFEPKERELAWGTDIEEQMKHLKYSDYSQCQLKTLILSKTFSELDLSTYQEENFQKFPSAVFAEFANKIVLPAKKMFSPFFLICGKHTKIINEGNCPRAKIIRADYEYVNGEYSFKWDFSPNSEKRVIIETEGD